MMKRTILVLAGIALATAACSSNVQPDETTAEATEPSTSGATAPTDSTTTLVALPPITSEVDSATMVIVGGTVLTMNPNQPTAEAVAVRGASIVAVGSELDIADFVNDKTQVIDLAGRTLLPGFVDGHVHYFSNSDGTPSYLQAIQDDILSSGVTTVAEMSVTRQGLAELRQLDDDGLLRVRTSVYVGHNTVCGEAVDSWLGEIEPTREWGESLRIGGIKIFNDGGACNVPASSYEKQNGGMGDLYMTADELAAVVSVYDKAGFQVAIHALGDRAIEATLDGLAQVITDGNPLRHRIEHNASVRPDLRSRYDEVGAVAMTFGSFPTCVMTGNDDRFQFTIDAEYQEWEWPWRDLIDQNPNTVFAWHGDYPVFTDSTPIANLAGYVTRVQILPDGTVCEPEPYHAKHAITVEEALAMMTMGSAYALDRETEVGSIEVDKLADFVVLSGNPTKVEPMDLFDLKVEMTVFNGEIVFGDV